LALELVIAACQPGASVSQASSMNGLRKLAQQASVPLNEVDALLVRLGEDATAAILNRMVEASCAL
jgi:hypothetical protein